MGMIPGRIRNDDFDYIIMVIINSPLLDGDLCSEVLAYYTKLVRQVDTEFVSSSSSL